jgi:hypothetical protein
MSKTSRSSGWDRNLHNFNKNRYSAQTKGRFSKIPDISSSDDDVNYSSEDDELDPVRDVSDEADINIATKSVSETSNQSSKQPSDRSLDKSSDQSPDKSSKQPSDKSSKQPSDKSPKQPSDKSSKQPSKQPLDKSSKQPSKQPSDKSPKQPSDKSPKQPSDKSSKQPSKQPLDKSSKQPSKQPLDKSSKQPSKQRLYGNRPGRFTSSRSADQGFKTPGKYPRKKRETKDNEIVTHTENESTCRPISLFFIDKKNGLIEKSTTKCEDDNIIESSFKKKHTRMNRKNVPPRFKSRNNRSEPPIVEKSSLPMTPNDRDVNNEITSNPSPEESGNSETKKSRVLRPKAPSRFDPPKSAGKNVRAPRLEEMSIEQALKILEKNGPIPDILEDESIFAAAKKILEGSNEPDVATNSTKDGDKNLSIDFDESSDNSDNSNSESETETQTILSDKASNSKVTRNSTFQAAIQPLVQSIKPIIIDAPSQSIFKSDIKPAVQPSFQPAVQPSFQPAVQTSFQPSFQPTFVKPPTQPAVQPPTQLTTQPAVQPPTQLTTQPAVQPPTQLTTQPAVQPPTQPAVQSTVQPTFVQPTFVQSTFVQPIGQSGDEDSDSKDTSTLQVIKGQIDGEKIAPLMPFITTAENHHMNPNINMKHLSVTKTLSKSVIHSHDVTNPITVLDPSNTIVGDTTGPVNMTSTDNFKTAPKVEFSPSINVSPDAINGIVGLNIMPTINSTGVIEATLDISNDESKRIDGISFKGEASTFV